MKQWDRRTSLQGDRAGGRRWFPLLGHYKNSRIEMSRERRCAGSGGRTAEEEKVRKPGSGARDAASGGVDAGGARALAGEEGRERGREGDGRKGEKGTGGGGGGGERREGRQGRARD